MHPEKRDFLFPPHSFSHNAHQPEPAQIPLPLTSDINLTDPRAIAYATGRSPAPKAGGSRRKKQPASVLTCAPISLKAKGKRKRQELDSDGNSTSDSDVEQAAGRHGGRRPGAGNYKDCDLDELLRLTERELPLGQIGWQKIGSRFKTWANPNNRPVRDAKSLERKFKQLVKTTKPTGSGKRPQFVTQAKAIDRLINERAGTRCVNDSELDNSAGNDNLDDDLPASVVKVETAVIRASAKSDVQPRRSRAAQSTELMQKLASALDPDIQKTRDDERASRSLQNTQIFTPSQQLRDSQATNDKLRGELDKARDRVHKLERSLDRARIKLEFTYGPKRKRPPTGRKHLPGLTRVRGKIRNVETFPEGGSYTTWVTDGSTATNWSDSDKENFDIRAFQQYLYEPPAPMHGLCNSEPSLSSPLRDITLPRSSVQDGGMSSSAVQVSTPHHNTRKDS